MNNLNFKNPIILLDAMGVIYQSGDDVGELLIPFIHKKGSKASKSDIENAYHQASLGQLTATQFWSCVGLSSSFEDEYLSLHQLNNGFDEFIKYVSAKNFRIACLSNDVSEWSKKLRVKFKLESYIQDWIISGDVRLRKPDPNIYLAASNDLNVAPQQILFIDDRLTNIIAAQKLGFQTILLSSDMNDQTCRVCHNFEELTELIKLEAERD